MVLNEIVAQCFNVTGRETVTAGTAVTSGYAINRFVSFNKIMYYRHRIFQFFQVSGIPADFYRDGIFCNGNNLIEGDSLVRNPEGRLFFWFFCVFSDVRNVNKREINGFRFSLDNIESGVEYDLRRLSKCLTKDFENNSRMLSSNYGNRGVLHIQSFHRFEHLNTDEWRTIVA